MVMRQLSRAVLIYCPRLGFGLMAPALGRGRGGELFDVDEGHGASCCDVLWQFPVPFGNGLELHVDLI